MFRQLPYKTAILTILFLALAGTACHAGETAHPWDNKRIYYIIEYMGRLRERGFFVRHPGSFQRRPCVITEEEKQSYAEHDSETLILTARIKSITTPTGVALQRHEEAMFGDTGFETIAIAAGEADFAASGFYGRSIRIPVPNGAVFEVSGEWLAAQNPQAGKTVTIDIIDRISRGVSQEQVTFEQRLSAPADGGPAVWLAVFRTENRPPLYARFTSDGRLLRLDSEGLTYQVVTRDDYLRGRIPSGLDPVLDPPAEYPRFDQLAGQPAAIQPGGFEPLPEPQPYPAQPVGMTPDAPFGTPAGIAAPGMPEIPIRETVPAWDSFAWLRLRAGPAGAWLPALSESQYAQIVQVGDALEITAIRNAPRVDANAVFPMRVPPDVQPYLRVFEHMPATNPAVVERARLAVADAGATETNVLRAVSYLAGWINQNIAVVGWTGAPTPVLDALRGSTADSAGHARLFATMARSLGIPSRVCQGFLAQPGMAVYHCWAEVWIANGWVPVDTTVSRVGLPAGYVLAERSGPDGWFRNNFAGFMRSPGLNITILSAGRETPSRRPAELVVGDRRTYAVSEQDWLANLYWGFALRLPDGWTGNATMDSVEITSPDGQASVKTEAMAGDYRAGQAELDANVASLRGSLERFRLIDSRVVAFDAEGATQALFIDFTCRQNNANLRCRQYLLPCRQRAFRISFWAPAESFSQYAPAFDSILAAFEY